MRKCRYITDDGWWDTDVTILPQIIDDYEITVVVSERLKQLKYEQKNIRGVSKIIKYQTIYRNSDIRKIFKSFIFGIKEYIRQSIGKQDNLIIYLKNSDIAFLLLFSWLLPRRRTIVGIHDFIMHKGKNTGLYSFFYNIVYRKFDYFLFFSETQQSQFSSEYPKKKAFYINMPLKDFGPIMKEKHNPGNRIFLFFGFIQAYKRLDLFIEASQHVTSGAKFIIAGACNDWDRYKALLTGKKNNVQCEIRFIANNEIAFYFQKADYLVLPYDEATQSGPLTIAYNYCLPIIATDIKLFATMVKNGDNGFLFHKGNLEAFIQTINHANEISNQQYSSLVAGMCKAKNEYQKTTDFKLSLENFVKENNI